MAPTAVPERYFCHRLPSPPWTARTTSAASQGYGPVVREDDEPPFHEPWEGRVHGINLSSDVGPAFRYSIERMGAIST